MSDLHDLELADTIEANARRRRVREYLATVEPPAETADRSHPSWRRIRAALCEHHGLPMSLDRYADLVFLTVMNATGPGRPSIHGQATGATKGA